MIKRTSFSFAFLSLSNLMGGKYKVNTDVVILVCRLNDRGWGHCDWGNEHHHHNEDNLIVDSSSDPRIRRNTSCANALRRLLNAGFRIIDVETIENCDVRIIYTLVRHRHEHNTREEAVSPENFTAC